MPPTALPSNSTTSPKRVRRPRAIQACNFCRSKKYRCDGHLPCSPCRKYNIDCVFRKPEIHNPDAPTYSIDYVKRLEHRLEQAEAGLRKGQSDDSATGTQASPADRKTDNVQDQNRTVGVLPSPSSDHQTRHRGPESRNLDESDESATEVVDVNADTNAVEFHGNTSSLAFLGLVCEEYGSTPGTARNAHERRQSLARSPSLVTTFHNNAFRKDCEDTTVSQNGTEEDYHPHQAYMFLDTYFKNLHFIHPVIDQADTFQRCEDLWYGRPHLQPRSFRALYFSLLSLGALIRTWTEQHINGMGRFEWSRKLFQKAEDALIRPGAMNDIHAVQALLIMAKVCQNEMNPNLAYTYLGLAIRTALSVGLNRNTSTRGNANSQLASKVWWGLYSLEVEMSFALGRPDTLGIDAYHNQEKPAVDETESAIIPVMLGLAQIMRNISIDIYLTKEDIDEKVAKAVRLEADMDSWIAELPAKIRPSMDRDMLSSRSLSIEIWPKLQSLVLKIRYLNVKMILLRPFLLHAAKRAPSPQLQPDLVAAISRCVQAAADTIEIIYTMYHAHTFFRTWWYNASYVTFAASILLYHAAQDSFHNLTEIDVLASAQKALEILEVMEDGVVAKKTANFIRPIISGLRERQAKPQSSNLSASDGPSMDAPQLGLPEFDNSSWQSPMSDLDLFRNGMSFFNGGFWDFDTGFAAAGSVGHMYPA